MLELTEESKRLTATFLRYRNDIDIFTEDEGKDKEFYKTLFNRLLDKGITINDVTPLGSKEAVINRCKNEPENGRKKLFIVDGDIAIIHGRQMPQIKNLFIHDAYCIENFLFEKETLIHFIYLNCAIRSKEDITKELNFEKWLGEYTTMFIDLFIHFALVDFFGGRFTLFNAKKYHIKKKGDYKFSPDLVIQDIQSLKNEILGLVDESYYINKYSELKNKWSTNIENLFKIVSGKDYLIPILLIKTKQFKQSNALPSLEEIKMALIQYCNLDRLNNLKVVIESL